MVSYVVVLVLVLVVLSVPDLSENREYTILLKYITNLDMVSYSSSTSTSTSST